MSSSIQPAPTSRNAAEVGKVLGKMNQIQPVMATIPTLPSAQIAPTETTATLIPVAAGETKQPKRKTKNAISETPFIIAESASVRYVTARIPDELHGRLYLAATRRRLARQPKSSVQDLIGEAIEKHLAELDAA